MVATRKRRRLASELYRSHVFLALITLVLSALMGVRTLTALQRAEVQSHMETLAKLTARLGEGALQAENIPEVRALVGRLSPGLDARLTVIGPDGLVWADSWADADRMENHGDRPEVLEARASGTGSAIRHSDTLNHDLLYVGIVVVTDRGPVVIRAARPLAWMGKNRERMGRDALLASLVIGALALVLAGWLVRRVTRVMERVSSGVERFAQGDLSYRIPVPVHDEFLSLVEGMNGMAGALALRMRQLEDRREEEAIILRSMVEGLLAVDMDERVIKANAAAARLLRMDNSAHEGRALEEVARHAGLHRLVARVLETGDEVQEELRIQDGDERVVAAHGCLLRNGAGRPAGVVVVLHDVTRLRQLEQVRREFVANVSHELKTPITSIRGFVETLQDGAVDDHQKAMEFLDILARQSARMQQIINDLLTLSRLEVGSVAGTFAREEVHIWPVLAAALQLLDQSLIDNGAPEPIVECAEDLEATINPPLVEQAVLNLVDNAIRHGGGADAPVVVRARRETRTLIIEVEDHGVGIPRDHQSRVFERFYRVDKGRSRERGGTGLGLSIVKHIAQAHGGTAEVESCPGKRTVFRLLLRADR